MTLWFCRHPVILLRIMVYIDVIDVVQLDVIIGMYTTLGSKWFTIGLLSKYPKSVNIKV